MPENTPTPTKKKKGGGLGMHAALLPSAAAIPLSSSGNVAPSYTTLSLLHRAQT